MEDLGRVLREHPFFDGVASSDLDEVVGCAVNVRFGADQYLYVVSGTGKAKINGRSYALSTGSLLLIERGDMHEIRNVGRGLLKTLNFDVPPAYDNKGEPLPAAKPEDGEDD